LRKRSKRVAAFDRELDRLTPALLARANGQCEIRVTGVCLGGLNRGFSRHHRQPRGKGGPNTMANVVIACGDGTVGCHGYIEHHREESYAKGWLVRMGQDPELVRWVRPEPPLALAT
jgi:hypothetical protein